MQKPKKSSGPLEVPQKASPVSQDACLTNLTGSESESTTSTCSNTSTLTKKSPKVVERKSPRSLASERKCLARVTELETQVSELQEDLKKTKNQLAASESVKRRAQQESEEVKKHLMAVTAKLEHTQNQLQELSESEDDRIKELRKIGQERDRAWQSEVEAVQQQHKISCNALVSAMNEIQRLRMQIEKVASSGVAHATRAESANLELLTLKEDMAETSSLVKTFRSQLEEFEKSEVEYQDLVNEKHMQLEAAEATIEKLRADGLKVMNSVNSLFQELEESKARINSLEEIVKNLQPGYLVCGSSTLPISNSQEHALRSELHSLQSRADELKLALEASEMRYHEEHVKSTMQIQSAYEASERVKIETGLRETELEFALNGAKMEITELKVNLTDKESHLWSLYDLNERHESERGKSQDYKEENELDSELKKLMEDVMDLKASLMDKETELQIIAEENGFLKLEMEKEIKWTKSQNSLNYEAGIDIRLESVTNDQDDNGMNDSWLNEQLEAAHLANSELEVELRRLKIQSEQWRKAAEMATAILVTEDNGRSVEKAGSLDSDHYAIVGNPNSPFFDDVGEESQKKKNMLKKIGVLWKKGQK